MGRTSRIEDDLDFWPQKQRELGVDGSGGAGDETRLGQNSKLLVWAR